MSIFKFIKAIFSTKHNCQYFIESAEFSYHKHRNSFPGHDSHFYLAQAWLAYMAGKGRNIDNPDMQQAALTTTYLCACVPHPKCARALGLFLLYKERPEEYEKSKQLQDEFNELILPVIEAQDKGTILDLYRKYNPKLETMQ